MIQRIQSLWLLLAAIAIIFAIELPFAIEKNFDGQQVQEIFADSYLTAYIIGILLSLMALVTIFLFKRRSNQKRLITLSILTCVLFVVLMYFMVEEIKNVAHNNDGQHSVEFRIGAVFPVFYIILLGMAYSGIRKDEKLIKSVSRLR